MVNEIKKFIGILGNVVWVLASILFLAYYNTPEYVSYTVGENFLPLYEIESSYKDDLSHAFELDDALVEVRDDVIVVYIENDRCKLTTTFDSEGNYLKTTTNTKDIMPVAYTLIYAICSFICGFACKLCVMGICYVLVFICYIIMKVFELLVKLIKSKDTDEDITDNI